MFVVNLLQNYGVYGLLRNRGRGDWVGQCSTGIKGTLSWQLFYAASIKVGNFWKVDNFEAWRG